MLTLLLLFTVVPAVELWLLIEVGSALGGLETIAICIVTGIVGARLAKSQGAGVLRRIQEASERGELPAKELVDGVMILVAGVVLITPGFITDAIGIALLLPPFRALFRGRLRRWFVARMADGRIRTNVHVRTGGGAGPRARPTWSNGQQEVYAPGTLETPRSARGKPVVIEGELVDE